MQSSKSGLAELKEARASSRGLFWCAGLFSLFANLLMLTGPIYMLQVYDRVLGSGSEETLVALTGLVVFLYGVMGFLDFVRGRILARIGVRFQMALDRRVYCAAMRAASSPTTARDVDGLRNIDMIQRFYASPAMVALFDLPWTPIFLICIFAFHPWLGWLAVAGGGTLIALTLANQFLGRMPVRAAQETALRAERVALGAAGDAETLRAMGMEAALGERWRGRRVESLHALLAASDVTGIFTSASKALRLLLQSAMLGLGAYLVLQGAVSAGAIIAASILLGRALQPVEQLIGQWPLLQSARAAWRALAALLADNRAPKPRAALPRPRAILEARQATAFAPGGESAALRLVNFKIEPGQACGVIGASGAGKSSLARVLTGSWPLAGGSLRLDGAHLESYDPATRGALIGYLPQKITLFDATIAENIARMSSAPDIAGVRAAAQKAGADTMINAMPLGYDTPVAATGAQLSGGQIQRLGLARALYGDPVVVVLDEPNSNLDNEGTVALNATIRKLKAEGKAILIMAHRPAAIQECDLLVSLDEGRVTEFGPKEGVLRSLVRNHAQIRLAPSGLGSVA